MNKEEFFKILTEKGVPEKFHYLWWKQWEKYNRMFRLKDPRISLEFFAESAIQKGCFKSAPW